MPHFAFCENCGNRVAIPNADAIRRFCNFCATAPDRKQQKQAQAELQAERQD